MSLQQTAKLECATVVMSLRQTAKLTAQTVIMSLQPSLTSVDNPSLSVNEFAGYEAAMVGGRVLRFG